MVHLTKDELTNLLVVAKSHSDRDWLMILVGVSHGLRASEICGMRGTQVKDGYLTVARLKGSLKTTQPLIHTSDPLFSEKKPLEALAKRVGTSRMFPISRVYFWKTMQRYCLEAGIPMHKAHPHVLKHTCAMLSIKTAGIENVRQYLGHKNISSTGAYLKVNDEEASNAVVKAMGV